MKDDIVNDKEVKSFATSTLQPLLLSFQGELQSYTDNDDPEPIHRIRVISRRLSNSLEIFSPCFPNKRFSIFYNSVKKICSTLGLARDLDVQIFSLQEILSETDNKNFWPGIKRVMLRLKQKRRKLQPEIQPLINSFLNSTEIEQFKSTLLYSQPSTLPLPTDLAPVFHLSWEMILMRLQEFLSYESYLYEPNYEKELHQMRIRARKLRYAMEIFAPLYPGELSIFLAAVRQSQDLLGKFHDCIIWQQYLSNFLQKETLRAEKFYGASRGVRQLSPGIDYLTENRSGNKHEYYLQYVKQWKIWGKNNLWSNLITTIKQPLC